MLSDSIQNKEDGFGPHGSPEERLVSIFCSEDHVFNTFLHTDFNNFKLSVLPYPDLWSERVSYLKHSHFNFNFIIYSVM